MTKEQAKKQLKRILESNLEEWQKVAVLADLVEKILTKEK
tara:strand:- start:1693 stop:1812 length:120 start_codon:yes stop_codon:yes gene_type:complete